MLKSYAEGTQFDSMFNNSLKERTGSEKRQKHLKYTNIHKREFKSLRVYSQAESEPTYNERDPKQDIEKSLFLSG